MLTQHARLLIDDRAVVTLSSEVAMAVGASLMEHARPALDVAAVERNHERSLTKSA